jgi:DNA-directed RNA polymerase I subunit RPA1
MDERVVSLKSGDVHYRIGGVGFGFYTAEEVLQLSVQQIQSAVAFDDLGRPVRGGLYDPRLGVYDKFGICATCRLGFFSCPGHCGHIELAEPVVNPLLFSLLVRLLRGVCLGCANFRLPRIREKLWLECLRHLERGTWQNFESLADLLQLDKQSTSPDLAGFLDQTSDVSSESSDGSRSSTKKPRLESVRGGHSGVHTDRFDAAKEKLTTVQRSSRRVQLMQRFIGDCTSSNAACTRCGCKAVHIRTDGCRIFARLPPTRKRSKAAATTLATAQASPDTEAQCQMQLLEALCLVAGKEQLLLPSMVVRILLAVEQNSPELCGYLFGHYLLDTFLLRVLLVPPSRFRLPSTRDDDVNSIPREHAQNFHYTYVLKANESVADARKARNPLALGKAVAELQQAVQELVDSEPTASMRRAPGIRQQLEHKEGIFRMHLMGKRVNYAARSVISPDPFLDVNEVGVPLQFAMKLSFPELVASWNLTRLQQNVYRGPQRYPGANIIERGDGTRIQIPAGDSKRSGVLAETLFEAEELPDGCVVPTRVFRHLQNGDRVLFNRQPTLHRVGLMAHRVRVLGPTENALRLHYANCGAYNADFDGDEMNMHVPQDWIAAAEAEYLLRIDFHYLSPTAGAPVRGLIQDHVLAAVLLTQRDRFFSWEEYSELIYAATARLWERKRGTEGTAPGSALGPFTVCADVPPAILYPQQYWTGKQVLSTVLGIVAHLADPENRHRKLRMQSRAKVSSAFWGQSASEESIVIIRDGELLQGVVDKAQIGAAPFGLVHCVHALYGPEAACDLLSCLGRLLTIFLRRHGHSTGVEDLLLLPSTERIRWEMLKETQITVGSRVLRRVLGLPADGTVDLEHALAEALRTERGRELELLLDMEMKKELASIASNVSEHCIPAGLRKPFPNNGFALMTASGAKGSQVNAAQISCLLGSTVLDGRRVPRSVAGWTLPCFRPYESTALAGGFIASRFLTGLSPPEYFFHCMAGREGLTDTAVKTARSGYLQRCLVKALEGVTIAYDGTVRESDGSIIQFCYGEDGLDPCQALWLQHRAEFMAILLADGTRSAGKFASQSPSNATRKSNAVSAAEVCATHSASSPKLPPALFEMYETLDEAHRSALLEWYTRSTAAPGDAVGVIAAQSIGEPSTQMTLNTFHFAGIGVEHVTAGVPRLRELLMFPGSAPATPFMQIPFKEGVSRERAVATCYALRSVRLRDLILRLQLRLQGAKRNEQVHLTLIMVLAEPELWTQVLGISPNNVQAATKKTYGPVLKALIARRLRELDSQQTWSSSSVTLNEKDQDSGEPEAPVETEMLDAGLSDTSSESSADSVPADNELVARRSTDQDESSELSVDSESEGLEKIASRDHNDEIRSKTTVAPGDTPCLPQVPDAPEDNDAVVVRFPSPNRVEMSLWLPSAAWYTLFLDELALAAAERVPVRAVENIRNTTLTTREDGGIALRTEGSNIRLAWTLSDDELDLDGLFSNHISEVLSVYGIEAARARLVRELQTVFAAYGIAVDYRHLSLIADYQTALGACRPFSRTGMRMLDSVPSALQRMSFESASQFLRDAALAREEDQLESASARLCLGQVVSQGTGMFSVLASERCGTVAVQ